ncbi:MAG: hypothetical protein EBV03_06430 [Proteobacteria bacterium]|nr:hypothetical protein [Pseudomonadota bacterium]
MGSMFSFVNAVHLSDMDAGAKTEQKLGDLRERAHDLEKRTGNEPMSWSEFSRSQPQEKPNTLRNMLIGAATAVGLVALVGVVMSAPALSLVAPGLWAGMAGAVLGGFYDTENLRRGEQVNKYESYLNDFEATGGHGHARAHEHAAGKTTHAADLSKDRGAGAMVSR